jgi:hypothetical protein
MERSMKKIVLVVVLLGGVLTSSIAPCNEPIYKYIDKEGTPCYADNLQAVPEQYRATAVIIGEESTGPTKTHLSSATSQDKQSQPAENVAAHTPSVRPLSLRLLISCCIVIISILVYVSLRKLVKFHEREKLHGIARAVFITILSLYLLFVHVSDVTTLFHIATNAVDDVERQSAEKGKKAAQAIKKLDAMFESAHEGDEGKSLAGGTER